MKAIAIELKEANAFVEKLHRHHDPVYRDKFRCGVIDDVGALRGGLVVCRECGARTIGPDDERQAIDAWNRRRRDRTMGTKYTIRFTRNGECPYDFDRQTNNIFRALWYLLALSLKYPIVDLEIRRGFIPCEKCTADWCDKSPAFEATKEAQP